MRRRYGTHREPLGQAGTRTSTQRPGLCAGLPHDATSKSVTRRRVMPDRLENGLKSAIVAPGAFPASRGQILAWTSCALAKGGRREAYGAKSRGKQAAEVLDKMTEAPTMLVLYPRKFSM